jgi:lipoyl synthase
VHARLPFCAVDTGNPRGWLDAEEPANAARSVQLMGLRYVVITSVDRDDLPDGGAAHYAACVRAIKALNPDTAVEALTPDFRGDLAAIETVVDSGLEVYAQNVETVRRLTHPVRDPRAGYEQTLDVLAHAKRHRPEVLTKTSLMLGLGETDAEIARRSPTSRRRRVDIVTFGQYLRPTRTTCRWSASSPPRNSPSTAHRPGDGLPRGGVRAAGALQLPRRPRVRAQQRRPVAAPRRVSR